MVSGLVTSPCDQLRIFSGEARLIRMASKSAITFAISKGLERNKGILRFLLSASTQYPVPSTQYSVLSTSIMCFAEFESYYSTKRFLQNFVRRSQSALSTRRFLTHTGY